MSARIADLLTDVGSVVADTTGVSVLRTLQ